MRFSYHLAKCPLLSGRILGLYYIMAFENSLKLSCRPCGMPAKAQIYKHNLPYSFVLFAVKSVFPAVIFAKSHLPSLQKTAHYNKKALKPFTIGRTP
jgi:hypothetical protein